MERSTGETRRKRAETRALEMLTGVEDSRERELLGWDQFRKRYTAEHLSGKAAKTEEAFRTAANRLESVCDVRMLSDLDTDCFVRFTVRLRKEGKSEATISAYRTHLMAALKWAEEVGLIDQRPKVPKLSRVPTGSRGRPLAREEAERIAMQLPTVVGESYAHRWAWNLEALWRSGFRLGETFSFYWEPVYGSHYLEKLDEKYPHIVISARAEKGFKDRIIPVAPDFANLLRQVPVSERHGPVFRWTLSRGDSTSTKTVSKRISEAGRLAGVIVGQRRGNPVYASAHDFRRSFAARWAPKVMPLVLKDMMRHASIETTLKYYVGVNADRTAQQIESAWDGCSEDSLELVLDDD